MHRQDLRVGHTDDTVAECDRGSVVAGWRLLRHQTWTSDGGDLTVLVCSRARSGSVSWSHRFRWWFIIKQSLAWTDRHTRSYYALQTVNCGGGSMLFNYSWEIQKNRMGGWVNNKKTIGDTMGAVMEWYVGVKYTHHTWGGTFTVQAHSHRRKGPPHKIQ